MCKSYQNSHDNTHHVEESNHSTRSTLTREQSNSEAQDQLQEGHDLNDNVQLLERYQQQQHKGDPPKKKTGTTASLDLTKKKGTVKHTGENSSNALELNQKKQRATHTHVATNQDGGTNTTKTSIDKKRTVKHSQSQKNSDGSESETGISFNAYDTALGFNTSNTNPLTGRTEKNAFNFNEDGFSYTRTAKDTGTKHQDDIRGINFGRDHFGFEYANKGKGGWLNLGDGGFDAGIRYGKNTIGISAYSNSDGYDLGLDLKVGNKGAEFGFSEENGENTTRLGIKAGALNCGGSATIIDRDENSFIDSPILGNSLSTESEKGIGYSQYLALVAQEDSEYRHSRAVEVQKKHGNNNEYTNTDSRDMEDMVKFRDRLQAGDPLDLDDIQRNQAVAITEDNLFSQGGGIDTLVYNAGGSNLSRDISRREIGRVGEGDKEYIRIHDIHSQTRAEEEHSGIVMDLVYNQERTDAHTRTDVLDYLIDAQEAAALAYAQEYAQSGLLPSWDHVADSERVTEMRRKLAEVRQVGNEGDWPQFLAENAALIQAINDEVRENVHSGAATSVSGVELLGSSRTESDVTEEDATTLLFFDSTSGSQHHIQRNSFTNAEGAQITEQSWHENKEGQTRDVVTSGSMAADSAVRIVDEGAPLYQNTRVDLSPEVLQVIGEEMNNAPNAAEFWQSMTTSVVEYYQSCGPFTTEEPDRFTAVTGPEDFTKLNPKAQLAYVQAVVMATAQKTSKRNASAQDSGFNAISAISLIEDEDVRGDAMMTMTSQITKYGRSPSFELLLLKQHVGQGGDYLLEQAARGRQANADVVSGSPTTWGTELSQLIEEGGDGGASILSVIEHIRREGGPALLTEVFDNADVTPDQVAQALAENSTDRPRRFAKELMVGTPFEAGVDLWWEDIASRLNKRDVEKLGEEVFEKPENHVQQDATGVDDENIRAQMAMTEQSLKNEQLIDSWADLQKEKGSPYLYANNKF